MLSDLMNRTTITVFAVFWVLFVAELFLRVFEPQAMLPRYVQAGGFGIRVNMPNQSYVHSTPEYTVEIHTNDKGIRAKENISYDNLTGKRRIIVLGDSFGMGYGVELEDSFTEVMKRELELASGQSFEIVNLSVSGYGTTEQLLMLQHEGLKYKPDLVLLTWHATDPEDNVRSGLYEKVNDGLKRKSQTYLPGVKIREFLFGFRLYRWLAGNSHFYNWVRREVAFYAKKILVLLNTQQLNTGKETKIEPKPQDDPLSIALLKEIEKEASKAGADFLILEIPIRASRTEFEESMSDDIRNQFDVISPIESFNHYSGELLYWEKSHGHFTPLGCEIVGKQLAGHFISSNHLNLQEEK